MMIGYAGRYCDQLVSMIQWLWLKKLTIGVIYDDGEKTGGRRCGVFPWYVMLSWYAALSDGVCLMNGASRRDVQSRWLVEL